MSEKRAWLYDLLFIVVLLLAGYLRLAGSGWGEGYHQHPDELFLSGVLGSLRAQSCDDPLVPIDSCPEDQRHWMSIGEYFDTAKSTLNPYNRGYSFFVYGTFPLALIRFTAEAIGSDGLENLKFLARQISALADLFTIFVLYLIVSGLYGRRVGLLAAAFSALTVMQIQQSHFFTTDLFTNLFMFLAILFAVSIVDYQGNGRQELGIRDQEVDDQPNSPDPKLPKCLPPQSPLLVEHWFWIYAWPGNGIQDQCGGTGAPVAWSVCREAFDLRQKAGTER